LLPEPFGLILVIACEFFSLHVSSQRLLNSDAFLIVRQAQLYAIELFLAARLILYVDALHHILEGALEKVSVGSTHLGALHLLLQFVR
jgi:hypothetical protein